jgi:hypothetical protein
MSEIPKSPFPELISDEQWSPIFIVFIMAFIGVALYQARMIWIMSGGTAQLSPDDLEELQAMSGCMKVIHSFELAIAFLLFLALRTLVFMAWFGTK